MAEYLYIILGFLGSMINQVPLTLFAALNSKHFDERRIQKYAADFDSALPFKYLELRDFLTHTFAVKLKRTLEQQHFELKKADLFEFFQTTELAVGAAGVIGEFADFLRSAPFRAYLMAITGVDLVHSEITMFGSRYEDTHYLLPHDDQLEGRQIAFLFYLSQMSESHGGELILYDTTTSVAVESIRIRPQFNSLVFFEVTPRSLHAVSEVIGAGKRYTLAGWFVIKGSKMGEYL